jgi:hypothetical protein
MSDTQNLDYAAGWRPNEGDVITGRVVELSVGHGNWGAYPIVVIRPENGTDVAVHAFHHSLRNRLLELKPRQGERIGIQYKGMRPSKSKPGQNVAIYIARIEGRDASTAWENLTPAGEPEPTQTRLPMNPQEAQDTQQEVFSAEDFTPPARAERSAIDDIPFS